MARNALFQSSMQGSLGNCNSILCSTIDLFQRGKQSVNRKVTVLAGNQEWYLSATCTCAWTTIKQNFDANICTAIIVLALNVTTIWQHPSSWAVSMATFRRLGVRFESRKTCGCNHYLHSAVFMAQRLVGPRKYMKQITQIERNQLAIYKRSRGFEFGATVKQINPGSGQSGTRTRDRWIGSPTRWPLGQAAFKDISRTSPKRNNNFLSSRITNLRSTAYFIAFFCSISLTTVLVDRNFPVSTLAIKLLKWKLLL